MVLKVISLDVDNTLIDFMDMKKRASDHAARAMVRYGLEMSRRDATEKLFQTYMRCGIESENAFQTFLAENPDCYEPRRKDIILAAAINAYLTTKYDFMEPYDDVLPTLRKLKSMRPVPYIIALSDAPKQKMCQRLVAIEVVDFFDVIIGFEDSGVRKPDPKPFNIAQKTLEEKTGETYFTGTGAVRQYSEILHVGDWLARDILGARHAGFRAAFAKYGVEGTTRGDPIDIVPDYILETFADLYDVVKNENS